MIRAALLLLSLLVPAAAVPTPPPDPGQRLELFRDRLFVGATINGRTVNALLDSGAEMTLVDDDFARAIGLAAEGSAEARGSGGSAEARFARNVTLSSASLELPGRTVAILDLGEVSERLIGRPVQVVIGRDLFDAARLRIDIAGGVIRPAAPGETPPGRALALTARNGIESFPVRVEGRAASAHFDLGNGSEVMVSQAYADRVGLSRPRRIVARRTGGGIGGAVERDIVVLRRLVVAGRVFRDVPAAIDRSGGSADLNIGVSILRHFLITADFPQRTIWLEAR